MTTVVHASSVPFRSLILPHGSCLIKSSGRRSTSDRDVSGSSSLCSVRPRSPQQWRALHSHRCQHIRRFHVYRRHSRSKPYHRQPRRCQPPLARCRLSLHSVLPTHALRQSLSQTNESYSSVEFPTYNLVNGTLLVTNYTTPGTATVSVDTGLPVDLKLGSTDGAPIHCAFVRTRSSSYISTVIPLRTQNSSPSFQLQISTSAEADSLNPILGISGDTDSFSLCTAQNSTDGLPINALIYKAEENEGLYDFSTCYPVNVQLAAT